MEGLLSDARGFFSQVCPGCQRRFKVPYVRGATPAEGGLPQLVHCPYCDQVGDDFRTPAQKKFQEVSAARLVIQRLKTGANLPSVPDVPVEMNDDLPDVAAFPCCDGSIRHDGGSSLLFCPFCGKPDAARLGAP